MCRLYARQSSSRPAGEHDVPSGKSKSMATESPTLCTVSMRILRWATRTGGHEHAAQPHEERHDASNDLFSSVYSQCKCYLTCT